MFTPLEILFILVLMTAPGWALPLYILLCLYERHRVAVSAQPPAKPAARPKSDSELCRDFRLQLERAQRLSGRDYKSLPL